METLPRSFYERSTITVAKELLGKIVVREWQGITLSGIIIETEAYCGHVDPASHAYKRETSRNKAMFGPVGHSYVYFNYGLHHCLNIVAREKDFPAGGVLIRGLLPFEGIETMKKLRSMRNVAQLMNGPGKVGQALHLTLADNHIDLTHKGELYVVDGYEINDTDISVTPRIGISKAIDNPWRFVLKNEVYEHIKESIATLAL